MARWPRRLLTGNKALAEHSRSIEEELEGSSSLQGRKKSIDKNQISHEEGDPTGEAEKVSTSPRSPNY